jgi:hypothetical protein
MLMNLLNELTRTLRTYWRIKSAVALIRSSDIDEGNSTLNYRNLPLPSTIPNLLTYESAKNSFDEIFRYIDDGHLAKDMFLRIISQLEEFYVEKLTVRALDTTGTLGALESRCEQAYGVTGALALKVDEIRERRNAFIHHGGIVGQKYIIAALNVFQSSGGAVSDPALVSQLTLSDTYLSYCVDVYVGYSAQF